MRPIGHTATRADRAAIETDRRLREAWDHVATLDGMHINTVYGHSYEILRSLRPSLDALHHLIIAASLEDDSYFTRLGAFVSAGYQLLPQRDILYDLQTPHLSYLGMFLKDKHLIITGSVGDRVGYLMRGSLTNEGVARFSFGDAMMGRLTNAGTMEHGGGNDMIGILRNTGTAGNLGDMMIGVLEDNGTSSTRGRIMLGNNCGSWNIPEHNRASFLIDILDQSQDYSKRRNSFRENYGWGR